MKNKLWMVLLLIAVAALWSKQHMTERLLERGEVERTVTQESRQQ
ncbi:hypothetical protein [Ferrimonas pelagia]